MGRQWIQIVGDQSSDTKTTTELLLVLLLLFLPSVVKIPRVKSEIKIIISIILLLLLLSLLHCLAVVKVRGNRGYCVLAHVLFSVCVVPSPEFKG